MYKLAFQHHVSDFFLCKLNEVSATYLFNVRVEGHILIKNDCRLKNKYLVGQHVPKIVKMEYNNFKCLN